MPLAGNKRNPNIRWKIYYHDPETPEYHTTWTNLDGLAKDAPVDGVICIVQPMDGGRAADRVAGADFYAIDEEGKWIGMDADGIRDRTENNIPFRALKNGRWINLDRYQEIMTRAFGDSDFGGTGKFRRVLP